MPKLPGLFSRNLFGGQTYTGRHGRPPGAHRTKNPTRVRDYMFAPVRGPKVNTRAQMSRRSGVQSGFNVANLFRGRMW